MIKISNYKGEQAVNPEKAIKIVYCLYRVSTKSQVEENDIPMQKVACHQFADSHTGWIIKKEFYELGVSGYKIPASQREQLQELKACAERGGFDVLLVFMFDRLGRRDDETPFVLRWFYESGIELWSVREGQKFFDNSTDDLLNYMYFWAAKTESLKTSIRIRTKLRQMVAEGKYTGGTAPFGYRLVNSGEYNHKGKMILKHEIIPTEAAIVQMIFQNTIFNGMGTHMIAEMINEMGILTHNGAKFQSNTVQRILRNPIYCGFYYRGGMLSPIIAKLQIIDDSLYNEVQRILDSRAKKYKERKSLCYSNSTNLLSGNIYCGYCGNKMNSTSNFYSYTALDGSVHWYNRSRYICAGRVMNRSDCKGQGTFSAKHVDSLVNEYIENCLNKLFVVNSGTNVDKRYKEALKNLKNRIRDYEFQKEQIALRIKALYNQVTDSLIRKGSYNPEVLSEAIMHEKECLDSIEKELLVLQNERDDLDTLKKSVALRIKEFHGLLDKFKTASIAEKRIIINKLIKKVIVGKGNGGETRYKVDIILNDWYADLI